MHGNIPMRQAMAVEMTEYALGVVLGGLFFGTLVGVPPPATDDERTWTHRYVSYQRASYAVLAMGAGRVLDSRNRRLAVLATLIVVTALLVPRLL